MTGSSETIAAPEITRVRHELRRRMLIVASSERITPNMLRIEFTGEDLAAALAEFHRRDRRFGGLPSTLSREVSHG